MKLDFEIIKEVGDGKYPDLLHFANTQAQVFYIKNGELYGKPSDKIDNGEWENITFQHENQISPDDNVSNFEVKMLPGWGAVGGYKTGNIHKMLVYEFAWEMDRYLSSGSIKHSIDNPISSFTLSLENPLNENPEHPGNVAVNEENSLLSPGAKVTFKLSMGDSEEYELGSFYVDRSNFTLLSETANVDGRNLVGKALKDQTLDENNEYWYNTLTSIINDILESAGLDKDNFIVENTEQQHWFNFTSNTTYMKSIEQILGLLIGWKISELNDGTIIVSSEDSFLLPQKSQYIFHRNKDIWSRNITRDDADIYRRVCVHNENFGIAIYRDVNVYGGWHLENNKTLYVQVANGMRYSQIEEYAEELSRRLENMGKVESFTGPLRPHLICGDEAVIVNEKGSKSLGLVTEITHNFGKNGFYTNFTVDSGGRLGKGRISDYIKKIATGSLGGASKIGYSDIDTSEENYKNIAKFSTAIPSSVKYGTNPATNVIDGDLHTAWLNDVSDGKQFLILDFNQRCIIDKIKTYRFPFETSTSLLYAMAIDYWNGSTWKLLHTINKNYEWENVHEFNQIETSKIRYRSLDIEKPLYLYEVEVYGYM